MNAVEWPHCQLRMSEKLRVAPSMIRVTGLGLPSAFRMTNVWARHDPCKPHWHVGPIGVHPDVQGRDIGTALAAALESPAGAPVELGPVGAAGSAGPRLQELLDLNAPFEVVSSNAMRKEGNTLIWEYDFDKLQKLTSSPHASDEMAVKVVYKK